MAKKKRGKTLVALLLVLVLLISASVGYDSYDKAQAEKEAEATAEEEPIDVLTVDADEIQSIYYKNEKTELTLIKNSEGVWRNESNQEVPLNSTYTDKMASVVESVAATKVVTETASDLSEFGLDTPTLRVTITKTDGSKSSIVVGNESPLGDGYYACLDGDSVVYLIASDLVTTYDYSGVALIEVADAPSIKAENITHLLVEDTAKGSLEITYEENNVYDTSDSGLAPYVLNQAYGQPMSGDSTNISTYVGKFTSLSYSQCVAYNSDDLEQYGLDAPKATIRIDYYEEAESQDNSDSNSSDSTTSEDTTTKDTTEKSSSEETQTVRNDYSYTLQIGALDEVQSVYYVKELGSSSVYTMSKSSVDAMLTYNRFDLVNKYAQLINVDSITEVQVAYDGETHSLSVDHTTTANEDGKEENTDIFYLDGTEYDESLARTLYQSIIGPRYDAEIPEGYHDETQPIVATFVFLRTKESGKEEVTAEYREYDDSFYTVTVNGARQFLVDKREVQQVITDMKAALNQ